MKKYMDKLTYKLKTNKKVIIFLLVLTTIGIISGTIFSLVISSDDKTLVLNQINGFFESIKNNSLNPLEAFKNSVIDNYSVTLVIWLLGISIIGLPIIILLFFSKSFIIGFTIGNIIMNYKVKGLIISLIYIFPHHIINILLYTILIIYSLALSVKLIYSIFKRKSIDFKPIINKYLYILLICIVGFCLTSLYEAFIMPKLINLILPVA